ncbi:Zinc transport protein ZntB [Alphaproteobacteria bacterium SO-S41]|nr:Zinc transport protein ZntB [Alphaproteobacteria bacterium SO-S41]
MEAPRLPGLVWGFRFSEAGGAQSLTDTCGLDTLTQPGEMIWLHLNGRDGRVPAFLTRLAELPDQARACLTDRDEHLAVSAMGGTVFGVFPDFERDFEGQSWAIGRFHFALTGRLLVTVRRHPLYSLEMARADIGHGAAIRAPVDIVELIVSAFHGRLTVLLDRIADTIDEVEDSVFDDVPRDERKTLGPVRRTLVRLHRHLRSVSSLLRRLEAHAPADLPDGAAAAADRMSHRLANSDLDVVTLQDRARLLHEEIDSKLNAQTNRHLFTLSVMSAFLLPPTLIVGFFGMNTADMPFQTLPGGTWMAGGLCVAAIALAWWWLRRGGIGPQR